MKKNPTWKLLTLPMQTFQVCKNKCFFSPNQKNRSSTLPETNMFAPENGCLEYLFPFGTQPIFRGKRLVSGSVPIWKI